MACLKTVPLLEGARLIILDEGLDTMHARRLVAGWLQMWKDKDPARTFDLLSFSEPKSWYLNEPQPFMSKNLNIHDYYTLDVNAVQENDTDTLEDILKSNKLRSTVIVDCLTSLIIYVGLSKALCFLEKLSRQMPQVICIYRRDFAQYKVPRIETLGTTYVKLNPFSGVQKGSSFTYTVKLIHRKLGGGILHQSELVTQSNASYEIHSEKIDVQNKKGDSTHESPSPKIESSFRIEINASEMQQREKTVLPYTLSTNATNTSKILYQPDDVDDIDEEDPDDDLCI